MDSQENTQRTQQEAREASQRLLRTVAWLAAAVVATMVVASCVLVLYLMST